MSCIKSVMILRQEISCAQPRCDIWFFVRVIRTEKKLSSSIKHFRTSFHTPKSYESREQSIQTLRVRAFSFAAESIFLYLGLECPTTSLLLRSPHLMDLQEAYSQYSFADSAFSSSKAAILSSVLSSSATSARGFGPGHRFASSMKTMSISSRLLPAVFQGISIVVTCCVAVAYLRAPEPYEDIS